MYNFTKQLFDYLKEAEKYGYSCLIKEKDIDRMVDDLLNPYLLEINDLKHDIYSQEEE